MGYRSVMHQGYMAAKSGKSEESNPYPRGSVASYDYAWGHASYGMNYVINKQGEVVKPNAVH